jgi:1-deoxy-D-xylulose-5-phosphate reductoisomerase
MSERRVCRVIVLGSTGSIGTQTLEVIEHLNAMHRAGAWCTEYRVVGLAAGSRWPVVRAQAARLGVQHTALADGDAPADGPTFAGPGAAERLVREVDCELVLAAITGAAGLPATLAAVELGRDIALANKETLVAAGALIVPAARKSGSRLLPVDSEHSALWQCLVGAGTLRGSPEAPQQPSLAPRAGHDIHAPPMAVPGSVERMILTASGGPFRTWSKEQIDRATPEEALKHPTWNMGPKVTIDCASLTNKGLEVIEAHWLFGIPGPRIEVVIHPQSIVHSLVEFADGSTIAQLGSPDMRGPIQYALASWRGAGARPRGIARRIDWRELRRLDFEPPDLERFPALALAYRAIAEGGAAGAIFNAANEAAVQAFLAGAIPFGQIPELVRDAMDQLHSPQRPSIGTLEDVLRVDAEARRLVTSQI